jgi:hypothetical protein
MANKKIVLNEINEQELARRRLARLVRKHANKLRNFDDLTASAQVGVMADIFPHLIRYIKDLD